MSGCALQSAERVKVTRRVFLQEDPAQNAFRSLIAMLDDHELVTLENEIDFYARSGVVSAMMGQLLLDADQPLNEVA